MVAKPESDPVAKYLPALATTYVSMWQLLAVVAVLAGILLAVMGAAFWTGRASNGGERAALARENVRLAAWLDDWAKHSAGQQYWKAAIRDKECKKALVARPVERQE